MGNTALTSAASRAKIAVVKLVDRILARALLTVIVLALMAPLAPASDATGVPPVSGGPACCAGDPADTKPSACGGGGVEMLAGGMCVTVCTGAFAFIADAPSCHATLTQDVPHIAGVRLTSYHTAPDPFPPKIPLTT